MDKNSIVEKLVCFGLTRQEAVIYLELHTEGSMNGYEVSKATGISRSNAYSGLAGLVEKGAAYISEGAATKYSALKTDEFCSNKIRYLGELKENLVRSMPAERQGTIGYVTIAGERHILDKLRNLLRQTEQRVYVSMSVEMISLIEQELRELLSCHKKVVLVTNKMVELPGAVIYLGSRKKFQIRVIFDSKYILTGEFGEGSEDTCLYSGQQNFVEVLKEALHNEIKLIQLTEGEI